MNSGQIFERVYHIDKIKQEENERRKNEAREDYKSKRYKENESPK